MLTIVVPSYNEARNVGHVIHNIAAVFAGVPEMRAIVVDDGSADDTAQVLASLRDRYPWLDVAVHPHNMGLGAALKTGYLRATSRIVAWLPADGQFDAKWILAFWRTWQRTQAPIVVGNITSSERLGSDGLFRLALSKALRVLFFMRKKRTINFNGLMLFEREQAPVASFKSTTGLINFEILEHFEARKARIEYQEIAVAPRLSGSSKVTNFRTYVAVLRDMLLR
jgi:glycosyltransferase involved in cell wall biosynthesis